MEGSGDPVSNKIQLKRPGINATDQRKILHFHRNINPTFKKEISKIYIKLLARGAGEITQQLGALTTNFAEELSSVPVPTSDSSQPPRAGGFDKLFWLL